MILFDQEHQIFKLDTPQTSYVMGLTDGKLLGHVYYGARLEETSLEWLLQTAEYPFTPEQNRREEISFLEFYPQEYAVGGVGDFRESALEIVSPKGQLDTRLCFSSYDIYEGKPELSGLPATWGESCDTLEITLVDSIWGIQVKLLYSAFRDVDVITRSVQIKNQGEESVSLGKVMSASLDVRGDQPFELLTLHGAWGRERQMERRGVGYGSLLTESLRGETGHQDQPFLGLMTAGTTQTTGEVYGMHLIYSGNFLAKVQKSQFDQIRMVLGIHPDRFQWKLNPGQSFQSPEAVLVYSNQGLGQMTRTFHRLYREHLIRSPWKNQERPILVNNWEATYFEFNTDKLVAIAKEAKACGIEMLVMDDGWFGKRNADNCSLGDWVVNEEKLPGGLQPLVEQVRALGMKFGIWMEPEMISPDSQLYRNHPDWVLHGVHRPALSREQLVLDLSNPEVEDYVYTSVANVLRMAEISYVKWDMNRPLACVGSSCIPAEQQGEIMHRHVLAVYRLQERLITEFPDLLLENCSGGGGRFDPGMLYYSPQIWCSDDADAIERLRIQEGTSLLYPLSTIGAHVSDCPNHTVGRVTPFATRGHVALAGTFGYELDVTKISQEERDQIPGQIATYKKYRELIQTGDYYRIISSQENPQLDCFEVVSRDQSFAILSLVQILAKPNIHSYHIRLQGLLPDEQYEIQGQTQLGSTWMRAGVLVKPMWGDFCATLLEIRRKEG